MINTINQKGRENMNLIKSLMGRRQFLIATGAASTAAMTCKNFTGFQTNAAMAAEKSGVGGIKGAFSNKYSHLLSPLKIGNVVLKSRMMQSDSFPRFLQGPETFPAEQVISWYANVAKNGCAVCMVFKGEDVVKAGESAQTPGAGQGGQMPGRGEGGQMPGGGEGGPMPGGGQGEQLPSGDVEYMPRWDRDEQRVQNYFAQMTDSIHFHGSKAALGMMPDFDRAYSFGNISAMYNPYNDTTTMTPGKEIPIELIQKAIEGVVKRARFYQALGFDMAQFHMSYRNNHMAHALSPVINTRKDKYGGSLENRARLALEMFQAVKKACGPNFLTVAHLSGEELGNDGGYTVKDVIEYAKIWEGALDILMVRGKDNSSAHPTAYNFKKGENPIIGYAETIKKGGAKLVIGVNGGFQDLNLNEEYIATGKTDIISMARNWWADPEYGKKAYEGKGEDVVPCLLCQDCHGVSGPPTSFCTVNPKLGLEYRLGRMIDAPVASRKVAVIGGGPAGMKAAITSAERGHKVTLYEKNEYLGGQLKHADYVSFKWTYKDFKDYLVRQVEKSGIEVILGTKATPEMIKAKGYDAVLLALGAEPVISDIPGAKTANVLAPIFVYGNKTIGKNVVVIGGEQIATETGMYLAGNGHNVTMLTAEKSLASDANKIYLGWERWRAFKTFNYITEATVKGIFEGKVTYTDANGNEKSIQADSVVIYAGRRPRQEEALEFYGSANRFFIIGDCSGEGNIVKLVEGNLRKSMVTAFAAASKI
jgi:2,4-dienoyl-CoA reductase-like NADH-dependent reductase (Old Yellow Enzyme family)/thioredoxin reductase